MANVTVSGVLNCSDGTQLNLEATIAAIDYLTGFSGNGRRILVFGDMFELGDQSQDQHIKVGQKCTTADLDLVYTVGTETIATDSSMVDGPEHAHFDSKEELETALQNEIKDGDKILVKGSRGMGMETIIDTLVN